MDVSNNDKFKICHSNTKKRFVKVYNKIYMKLQCTETRHV